VLARVQELGYLFAGTLTDEHRAPLPG